MASTAPILALDPAPTSASASPPAPAPARAQGQAQAQGPLSEACGVAINYIASYELNVSDGYLSMVCYFDEDPDAPVYVPFFQDQVEVKKGHARQFIRYLKERKSKVCLPVVKRLDKEYWGTNVQAIVMALELENGLHKLLQDLQNLASQKNETDLLEFLKRFVGKQKRNIKYLEYQHSYQKELERLTSKEGISEQFGEASGRQA